MAVARADGVSLGNPTVGVDVQVEAFAAAAGVDLEVGRLSFQEANAVIPALLQLVAHLVGVMRASGAGHEGQGRKGADGVKSLGHGIILPWVRPPSCSGIHHGI
jgi:hypothetical protein